MENDWYCIQKKPTMYAYGHLVVDKVEGILATIERLDNGNWRYRLAKWSAQGIEPSAETAKQSAIQLLHKPMQI